LAREIHEIKLKGTLTLRVLQYCDNLLSSDGKTEHLIYRAREQVGFNVSLDH